MNYPALNTFISFGKDLLKKKLWELIRLVAIAKFHWKQEQQIVENVRFVGMNN